MASDTTASPPSLHPYLRLQSENQQWETVNENTPDPTMDHRGMVPTKEGLLVVGGMAKDQQVTPKVNVIKTGK